VVIVTATGQLDQTTAFGYTAGHVMIGLQLGIYVFFTLSGYLLARPFIRAFMAGDRMPDIPDYLRNRLLRIVPAFWVVTAIVLLRFGVKGSGAGQVLAVFAFAQTWHRGFVDGNMVQAWTLDAEMIFYLLLPIAALALTLTLGRLRAGPARLALVTAVLGGALVLSFYARTHGGTAAQTEPTAPYMLFAFAPGIALAAIETLWGARLRAVRWGAGAGIRTRAGGRYRRVSVRSVRLTSSRRVRTPSLR
jgi:peptidoglycan/LPS O-acetylase OafA/YrhL